MAASSVASASVSVICTAKNAVSTIKGTIDSIRAQTMPNWEMIIVDDGSTDDTVAVVSRYARADPRIKLVTTGGIGRGSALNRALAETATDLVANIDADDESHPERLQHQVEAMARHPQLAVLCTQRIKVDGDERPIWATIDAEKQAVVTDVTKALALSNPVCHSSVMMRKPAITRLGGYSEGRRLVLDYDLWVRCAAGGLRLGELELPLTAKRLHPGQHYLHSARLNYLVASLGVQARGMRTVGVSAWQLPMIALRLVWLVLPMGARRAASRFTGR